MAQTTANVVVSTDTFQNWLDKTNELSHALSSVVVTANSTLANTTGRMYVAGLVAANTFAVTSNLFGASVSGTNVSKANLNITSNVSFTTGNLVISSTSGVIANGAIGTSGQVLTSNGSSVYWSNGAELIIAAPTTISNTWTFTSSIVLSNTAGVIANGSVGSDGQLLASNGSSVYWTDINASVGDAANTQVIFNDSGGANGVSNFTFNKSTNVLTVTGVGRFSTSVNSALYTIGSTFTANTLGVYHSGVINAAAHTVGTSLIANTTGVFHTGTVNAATISVGTALIANTTRIAISTAVGVQANGTIGTNGQVLTSNGTTVYWAAAASGANLTSNNTSSGTFYLPMANTTSGSWTNAVVSDTKLFFVPSTGTLNATVFNSLSDKAAKTNITSIVGATDTISNIEGVEFDWVDTGKTSAGVIAQELEEILPFLVDDNAGVKSVNYNGLIAYLVQSVKELNSRIAVLEGRQ